jgi:hypothetical protein
MTIDELDKKIQDFMEEMRNSQNAISASQLNLAQRLDTLDLNGAAPHLKVFGYFLRDHPDFMQREAESETKRVQQEIALNWIAEKLHLNDFRKKLTWVMTAILTGILLTFGSNLINVLGAINSMFHAFGHTIFK